MRTNCLRVLTLVALLHLHGTARAAITYYGGDLGSPAVNPAFTAATASHNKTVIDFDNDGFTVAPHAFTPIPTNHYASLGVRLINLDARSVGGEPWAHSPPMGAWHTGFSAPPIDPYSFVFDAPVASFGLFTNDVEGAITVTVKTHLGLTQTFVLPFQGGANITRFHGFAADANVIDRLDFATGDYHLIDDVQFGYVPEPGSALLIAAVLACAASLRRRS